MWAFERRWADVILGSFVVPGAQGLMPEAGEVDYLAGYESMYGAARPLARVGLRAALWLVALSPLWLGLRLRTFATLAPRERNRLLGRLIEHGSYPVRESVFLLKLVACLALFASESVRTRSGYDGRPGFVAAHTLHRGAP